MKIFLRRVFVSLFAIMLLYVPLKAHASSGEVIIDSMNMIVDVLENGDADVEETLVMDFHGDFNGAFRDISANGTGGIENFRAYLEDGDGSFQEFYADDNAKNGDYGVYSVEEKKKSLYRVKLYVPSENERRTFKITYKIKDFASLYNDAGEVYFNLWDEGYESGVKKFSGAINLPNSSQEGITAYLRGKHNYGFDSVTDKCAEFSLNDIGENDFITAHLIFSKSVLSYANKSYDYDGRKKIEDDEAAELAKIEEREYRNAVLKNISWYAFFVLSALNIFLILKFIIMRRKQKVQAMEKPSLITPALVSILNKGIIDGRAISGTMIDLYKKGFLDLKKGEGKDNYLIHIFNCGVSGLKNHEVKFLKWIYDAADENGKISTDDIKSINRNFKRSRGFNRGYNEWVKEAKSDYKMLGFSENRYYKIGILMIILFVIEFVNFIFAIILGNIAFGVIGIMESVIILILAVFQFVILTDMGYAERKAWKEMKAEFKNRGFEEIENKYPASDYMPYFITLGLSEDILKGFRNFIISDGIYDEKSWIYLYLVFDDFSRKNSFTHFMNTSYGGHSNGGMSSGGGGGCSGGGAGGF